VNGFCETYKKDEPEEIRNDSWNSNVFDRKALINRVMGDEALAATLIDSFLNDVPKQIHALRYYVEIEDLALAGAQAHQIKGVAGNIGGIALQDIAHTIEKAAKAADLVKLEQLMTELNNCFFQLKNAMESKIKAYEK